MPYITDEPARGAIGDLRVLQQPGLDTFRRFIHGDLPAPPIWRLTGMHPTEVTLGKATFAMPVTPWLADCVGIYWGGNYALLADFPLAAAIWTTLPAGKALATSELNLCFIRPLSQNTRTMVAHAETVHSGGRVGLSTVQITDQDGRMLAFGSTRCLISDFPVDPDDVLPEPDLGPEEPPDPHLRPPPAMVHPIIENFGELPPIDIQRMAHASGCPHPIWQLTGYRPIEVGDGHYRALIPSSRWFSNGSLAVYGGLLALAAEFTMGAAIHSTLSPGDLFATLDLHIRITRPAHIDSGNLALSAEVRHRGRQLRVCSCNIDNAEGKRVAMASASAMVIKGGARLLSEGLRPEEIIASANAGLSTPR